MYLPTTPCAYFLCATLLGFISSSSAARAETDRPPTGKPRLAVLGLSAPNLDEQLRLALADIVSVEAQASSSMEVATASDTQAFLTLNQQKQLLGCNEEQCLGQFAGLVDAQQLISGSVNRAGEKYVVALQLIDMVNGRVMERASKECEAKPEALVATVRSIVPGLFGVVGKITLWNQPDRATIYLDGRLVGRTPVDVVPVGTAGKHQLEVLGPAITPWKTEVDVAPGAELRLRALNRSFVDLEVEAKSRRSWGLGMGGGGIAALLLGGALYAGALGSDARLDGIDRRVATQSELDDITATTKAYFFGSVAAFVIGAVTGSLGAYYLLDNPAEQQLAEGGAL